MVAVIESQCANYCHDQVVLWEENDRRFSFFFNVVFCIFIYFFFCSFSFQLIHTISVVDQDEPQSGHRFYFTLAPEASNNRHFTLWDVKGEIYDQSLPFIKGNRKIYQIFSILLDSMEGVIIMLALLFFFPFKMLKIKL